MGSHANSPVSDQRRVLDALRWIVRDLRLAQGPGDLSTAQVFVLHLLQEEGTLSVGDLAERTATDPSSVSVVVRKLHEKGLVEKAAAVDDKRRLLVSLTPAGRRQAEAAPTSMQRVLMDRLAALGPEDIRILADLLERVTPGHERPAPMFFQEGDRLGDRLPPGADPREAHRLR